MTAATLNVRRASIRVALAAAAVVGVVYLIVAVAIWGIATDNLTGQLDQQLNDNLHRMAAGAPPDGGRFQPPPDRSPIRAPLLVWTVSPDGTIDTNVVGANLPASATHVTQPTTISISGIAVRIAGAPVGDRYLIVGQTMESVTSTQGTIILAEVAIAPALLLIVFLGAMAVGRRVAGPIELARQRELEFTADASHELRTPLSVIEAQTSLALAQERDGTWYRTAFQRVDQESRRMRKLLEDMLWLARFDVSHGSPNAEPVDVGVMAEATADRFGAVAEARRLRLAVERIGGGDPVVTMPPEWLDRLMGVLLDNACKYSPEGGMVRVLVESQGGRVRLGVEDSGPGIPEAERARIFDRFHRATDQAGGAGLGLAIADAIVRATGGRWRVGASDAGGASMSVSWPAAFPERREGARASAATSGEQGTAH